MNRELLVGESRSFYSEQQPMPRRPRGAAASQAAEAEAEAEAELEAELQGDFVDSVLDMEGGIGGETPMEKWEMRFKSKNLEAERRRRGKLNTNILALRAIVPKITKVHFFFFSLFPLFSNFFF